MVGLENLRLRALALRSSIHNEHQLSTLELCGMVAKKTNELIDVVNDLCEYIDNLKIENGLIVSYDQNNEQLTIGVDD